MSTRYYEEGSLERVSRAKGPDVWVYRWRENRVECKKVLGNVERLRTKAEARRDVENFRAQINSELQKIGRMTLGDAWGHFQEHGAPGEPLPDHGQQLPGLLQEPDSP